MHAIHGIGPPVSPRRSVEKALWTLISAVPVITGIIADSARAVTERGWAVAILGVAAQAPIAERTN